MTNTLSLCVVGPKIYTAPVTNADGHWAYSSNIFESFGNSMINIGEGIRHLCTAVSPILLPYLLYRYPFIGLLNTLKYTAIFYTIAFTLRTFGRFVK